MPAKKPASAQMFYSASYDSPIGPLLLCTDGENLCGLWMDGQKYHGASIPGQMVDQPEHPFFDRARAWLDAYFAGERPAIKDLPLKPYGSDFRQIIWKLLCEIPYGQTTTYGELGKRAAQIMGKEHMASLAVGGAVGHNPISVIVPCHRVVGADGSLTGYAGGLDKKIYLLEHEGLDMMTVYRPAKGTAL